MRPLYVPSLDAFLLPGVLHAANDKQSAHDINTANPFFFISISSYHQNNSINCFGDETKFLQPSF